MLVIYRRGRVRIGLCCMEGNKGLRMLCYEEKLLETLVEKYRNSKKDNGTNAIVRRTQLDPEKLYKDYRKNSADMEQIKALHDAVSQAQERGFLSCSMRGGLSNEIDKIYLTDEKVEEIERYLSARYGYVSKPEKKRQVEQILRTYEGRAPVADVQCGKLRAALEQNRIPKDYRLTAQVLKALVFVENNRRTLYLREASMLIYGNSKYFEENTLEAVCNLLRAYYEKPCREDELPDEILEEYHIVKEKQKLCVKGAVTLWVREKSARADDAGVYVKQEKCGEIAIGSLRDGVEFYSDELTRIEKIEIHAKRLMTVENRSSYFRCGGEDTVFFYLGGYATRFQRDFLKKIYTDNPDISYLHFGDIDAGGFYILEHLRRVTGIPFAGYRMSVKELQDERFASCLQTLTSNDRRRLESLSADPAYAETVNYMLAQGVKLEQEIVSLAIVKEATVHG